MKKIIINLVIVIALVGVISFVLAKNKQEMKEKAELAQVANDHIPVTTVKVGDKTITSTYNANGSLEPEHSVEYGAKLAGHVTQILVKEGDEVRKGQLLARLEDGTYQNQLALAKASYEKAKKDKERFAKLIKSGGVTQQQYDNAELQYVNAKEQYEMAQRNVSDTYIKAPIAGTINNKMIEVGSYMNPGKAMFEIVNTKELKLKVNLTETQVLKTKVGDSVLIRVNALPGEDFEGVVSFIAVKANNSLTYPVKVQVSNTADKELKAGMYATAYFDHEQKQQVLALPREAVVGSLQNPQVFVVQKGKAILRNIVVGEKYEDYVAVSNGLKPGEVVVTSGQINLQDGTPVEIRNN